MKKAIVVISAVLLASCSAKLIRPSQTDADRGASKFHGLTVAELSEGRTIYKQKCTQCHEAKKPASKGEAGWREVVPEMADMAKNKGKEEISSADQDKILKYLITMSGR